MNTYLRLTITDTLSVPVDGCHAFNPLARVTRTFWYRLPRHWTCAGHLLPHRRDQLVDQLYAADRCAVGGSRYVIVELDEFVLDEREVPARPWLGDRAAFYAWREGDVFEEVIPAQL